MFFILISNLTYAQDFHVNLKATGLTCAMCSYSTQRSLERLDFVESIVPDLEQTSFLIDFKKDKFIDFDLIQEKVEDAGFFVGEIEVIFSDEITTENDKHSVFNGNLFHFFSDNDLVNLNKFRDPRGKIAMSYGVTALPTTVVIDPSGKEIGRIIGDIDWNTENIRAFFRNLLKTS